jgi:acetoin utilization protein AcuB
MLIRHLMTRRVHSLTKDTRCRDALRLFRKEGIRHAPIVDGERLVGIVSERDLLRQLPNTVMQLEGDEGWSAEKAIVAVAMTRDPLTCRPSDAIDEVARGMLQRKVSCLPVVEDGRVVGIVTSADLFRGFASITAGGEGRRVSLMVPKSSAGEEAGLDPVSLGVKLGLRITSLITYVMDNGAELFLMQVDATEEQVERLVSQAGKHGALHLGSSQAASRRPA